MNSSRSASEAFAISLILLKSGLIEAALSELFEWQQGFLVEDPADISDDLVEKGHPATESDLFARAACAAATADS